MDCGPPSDVTPGDVSAIDTAFGSIATYVCDEGFLLQPSDESSRQRQCQADRTWFGPDPTCAGMLNVQNISKDVILIT